MKKKLTLSTKLPIIARITHTLPIHALAVAVTNAVLAAAAVGTVIRQHNLQRLGFTVVIVDGNEPVAAFHVHVFCFVHGSD